MTEKKGKSGFAVDRLPSPKKSPDYGRLAVCDQLGSLSGLRLPETPTIGAL
jgi:hypothetical protein